MTLWIGPRVRCWAVVAMMLAMHPTWAGARTLDEAIDVLGDQLARQIGEQEVFRITILPLRLDSVGTGAVRAVPLTRALGEAVARSGRFQLMDPGRAEVEARRLGLPVGGLADGTLAARIGRAVAADAVITGSIESHGAGVLELTAQAFSTQRGVNIASARVGADARDQRPARATASPTADPPRRSRPDGMTGSVWSARIVPTAHPWWLACPEAQVQLADAGRLRHRCRPGDAFDQLAANGWRQEGRTLVVTFEAGQIRHAFPEAMRASGEIAAPAEPGAFQTLYLSRSGAVTRAPSAPADPPRPALAKPEPPSSTAFSSRDPSGQIEFALRSVSRGSSGTIVVEVDATNAGERVEIGIGAESFALDADGAHLPLRAIRLSGRNAVAGWRGVSRLRALVPTGATVVLTIVYQPAGQSSDSIQLVELDLGEFGVHAFRAVPLPYVRR